MLTTKLDAESDQPKFLIDIPRTGRALVGRLGALCTAALGLALVLLQRAADASLFTQPPATLLTSHPPSPHCCSKFVVGLGEKLAPTDVEEGMRVGVDQQRLRIQLPLPTRLDSAVSMMQVGGHSGGPGVGVHEGLAVCRALGALPAG